MAGVKITDLVSITEAASDDLLYIVDVSDNTSGPQGTSKAIEVGDLRGYKVYTALLTQSGTDAPTAIELENTIGEITFNYISIGTYSVTISSLFTADKTISFISNTNEFDINSNFLDLSNVPNTISIKCVTASTNAPTDGIMSHCSFEIRVYN
jgi:hypothetical protein